MPVSTQMKKQGPWLPPFTFQPPTSILSLANRLALIIPEPKIRPAWPWKKPWPRLRRRTMPWWPHLAWQPWFCSLTVSRSNPRLSQPETSMAVPSAGSMNRRRRAAISSLIPTQKKRCWQLSARTQTMSSLKHQPILSWWNLILLRWQKKPMPMAPKSL